MAVTKDVAKPVTKRRGRKPAANKKAETKKKVDKIFQDLPNLKNVGANKSIEKPQPKDNDSEWLLKQSDASDIKIKELETELIQYKESYEKLLNKDGGSSVVSDESIVKLQSMFTEMVRVRNRQGKKANIILDYTGTGPQGLLQQLQAIFPFLK